MPSWMTVVLSVVVVVAPFSFPAWDTARRLRNKNQALDLMIASALPKLDCIIGDKHYLGSECEVVKTFRWEGCRVRGRFRTRLIFPRAIQLCRTNRGVWFLFDPANGEVTPCDEGEARNRLSNYYELYAQTFGKPDVA